MENLETKIELLAKGKLSDSEANELIENSNSDLGLKSEIAYEKYITKAVSEHRKMALKARLQSIPTVPITNSTFGNLGTNSILAIKSAAVVVASLGLGASVYFYSQSSENKTENTTEIVSKNETIELNPISESNTTNPNKDINEATEKQILPSENSLAEPKTTSKVVQKPTKTQKNVPNMLAFEDNSQAEINANMDETPLVNPLETQIHKITSIDIKNITDGKFKFHYLLKDNILTLYGNFEASPYEIIERNDNKNTFLYLFYNKNYYFLQNTDSEIHKLKKIDDKELVSDLSDSRIER